MDYLLNPRYWYSELEWNQWCLVRLRQNYPDYWKTWQAGVVAHLDACRRCRGHIRRIEAERDNEAIRAGQAMAQAVTAVDFLAPLAAMFRTYGRRLGAAFNGMSQELEAQKAFREAVRRGQLKSLPAGPMAPSEYRAEASNAGR